MIRVVLGLIWGVGLGCVYFGALWWTVRRIPTARRPGVLVATSYVVRLGVLGAGFMLAIRQGGAWAGIAALVGVVGARRILVGRVGDDVGSRHLGRARSGALE